MEAMFAVLARPTTVADGHLPLAPGGAGASGLALQLVDVRFGYGDGREVLKGCSLSVAPGESIGIVGPSGSGKSTLLRLLLRMYDPTSGSVLIDGLDARSLKLDSLRAATALVPQDCALFTDTLGANIGYGKPGAGPAEVAAAAAGAQLSSAVAALPEGVDTRVGERGV